MGLIVWGPDLAGAYAAMFGPSALDPVVDLLAELGRGGPALEFALIGPQLRGVPPGEAPFTSDSKSQVAVFEKAS